MIVLVGASASGKTEVTKVLAKKYDFKKFITHTTRPIRQGEINDVDYHFVTKQKFEELIKQDYFIEYTIYNGNYYSTSKKEIDDNKVVAIDINGLNSFKQLNNKNIVFFKLVAGEKTRFNRMLNRGDTLENTNSRIINDRSKFADDIFPDVDFEINTENLDIEGVADLIYKLYQEKINQ